MKTTKRSWLKKWKKREKFKPNSLEILQYICSKKISFWGILVVLISAVSCAQEKKNPFWNDGQALFEVKEIFTAERFPNVVVALDGTVIATWGKNSLQVRRSEDGGTTWGAVITVADQQIQGGGAIVDETSGDILLFTEEEHPPAPSHLYHSKDNGKSWEEQKFVIAPDSLGNTPSMHMNEHGITLQHGPHKGRLIRPTRYYASGNDRSAWPDHYTNAIYSDDGGQTWQASAPFPAKGTGEAALVEMSDGRIYYNSRRHLSTDDRNPRMRYTAWSEDGGQTWEDLSVSNILPDGAKDRDYGLMGGLVRLPVAGHDILLFSNIISSKGRKNGAVWASFDGGKTWLLQKVVEPGSFAYSSLAAGRAGTPSEGQIYLLYESDGGAKIAHFNLPWLTGGKDWRKYLPE